MAVRMRFPARMRLSRDVDYRAVYGARVKKTAGPISLFSRPNGLRHPRLGLSVGRAAGEAVERNRAKRLIREAFRLARHDLPRLGESAYDYVVAARSARGLTLDSVRRALEDLAAASHRVWVKRRG